MFCPRCGRNLNGDEYVCPECGNILREDVPPAGTTGADQSSSGAWVFFLLGFLAMLLLTYFVGFYFLFLFIPVFVSGGRKSKTTMLFLGAMLGTALGMICKLFI